MKDLNTIVGVYNTYDKAIKALEALKASGLPEKNISFISKADIIDKRMYATSNEEIINAPVEIGVVLGPVIGLLSGLSLIAIPGLGLIYGAGAMVGALAGLDIGLIGGGITTI